MITIFLLLFSAIPPIIMNHLDSKAFMKVLDHFCAFNFKTKKVLLMAHDRHDNKKLILFLL